MRTIPRTVVLTVLAWLMLPSVAIACLWDEDTIKMERTRFPSALELITGKFLRHSPEFYKWRIDDRLKRLETDPYNVALLDDLAVAYDKTGQHDRAIETALRTETIQPGRYETAANLGTFYFHAGKLTEGVPHIDRALKINPDAHFGREKYQKLLVEYVLKRRNGGPLKLPMATVTLYPDANPEDHPATDMTVYNSFADHLWPRIGDSKWRDESPAAIKGVLGMMKFGQHDSPVLLEALGTLLTDPRDMSPSHDAKLLAARAFLKASYEVPDGPARNDYRRMADHALYMQTPNRGQIGQVTLEQVEVDFQKELAEATKWYADLHERELSWIRDGKDPEAEFDKLYEVEPEVSGMDTKDPMSTDEKSVIILIISGVVFALALAAGVVGVIFLIRRFGRARMTRTSDLSEPTTPITRDTIPEDAPDWR